MAKNLVIVVIVVLASMGGLVGGVLWLDRAAELRSRTFCESISIGSNVQSAIQVALSQNILYGSIEKPTTTDYSFYFPATMFNKAVCYASSDKNGSVTRRVSIMEFD